MQIIRDLKTYIDEDTYITIGKFDGFHRGHMLLIDDVMRNKDKSEGLLISLDLGQKSIMTGSVKTDFAEKAGFKYYADIKFTDELRNTQPDSFLRLLIDNFHMKGLSVGSDFRFGYGRTGDIELLKDYSEKEGFKLSIFDKLCDGSDIISSSLIRDMIARGDMDKAAGLLGHPFSIAGTVLEGKRIGRTIGFPTANIYPDISQLLPRYGAYKTKVSFYDTDEKYDALTNVGIRPTLNGHDVSIETYIKSFSGDIYGKEIRLDFVSFLRPEKRFDSLDELKKQIDIDLHQ